MPKTTVKASHEWSDGTRVKVSIKTAAFPDSLDTIQDIADQCVDAFVQTMREVTDNADDTADDTA